MTGRSSANQRDSSSKRRILGSPFKSPENVNNKSSGQSLFASNVDKKGDALSPTPNRLKQNDRGVNFDHPIKEESSSDEIDQPNELISNSDITCPICNENMITLNQLNQHIDDVHSFEDNDKEDSKLTLPRLINSDSIGKDLKNWLTGKTNNENVPDITINSPLKKTINLDLLDDNKGFTFRDNISNEELGGKDIKIDDSKINRSHWKQPSQSSTNRCSQCNKVLNVKNGMVNCRKCGDLFCNQHTHYKIRLRNSTTAKKLPLYEASSKGVWSRCCENCYFNKPDLFEGTSIKYNDLTRQFKKKRQESFDEQQINRIKLQKKFIKLVNLMADNYLWKINNQSDTLISFNMLSIFNVSNQEKYNKEILLQEQISIVGEDNWSSDEVHLNCSICFTKFNFIIRKHHCRLCGQIVCDDSFGERKNCSIIVPINKLLDKLSNLNYSLQVRENWHQLMEINENFVKDFSIRCCKNCKDGILFDWRLSSLNDYSDDQKPIFKKYDELLMIKNNINQVTSKYKQLIEDDESDLNEINKLRNKLMGFIKDLEDSVNRFKYFFFNKNLQTGTFSVNEEYHTYSPLINNIHNGFLIYLQEHLLHYKELNQLFKERENRILQQAKLNRSISPNNLDVQSPTPKSPTPTPASPPPPQAQLTKKQIRELREQLMVMNEQKFIIGNMISDTKKQRKFDELTPLIENDKELSKTIESLEIQLGDYGF